MRSKLKIVLSLGPVIIISLLAGCATLPGETDSRSALRSSSEAYWKHRLADRYEDAYKMEDREGLPPFPGYLNKAMAIKKGNPQSFSVKEVTVEGDKGMVALELLFLLPPVKKPFSQVIQDKWVNRDGIWRHRLQN